MKVRYRVAEFSAEFVRAARFRQQGGEAAAKGMASDLYAFGGCSP